MGITQWAMSYNHPRVQGILANEDPKDYFVAFNEAESANLITSYQKKYIIKRIRHSLIFVF